MRGSIVYLLDLLARDKNPLRDELASRDQGGSNEASFRNFRVYRRTRKYERRNNFRANFIVATSDARADSISMNATERDRKDGDGEGGEWRKKSAEKGIAAANGPGTRPNGNSLCALCSRGLSTQSGRYLKTATEFRSGLGNRRGPGIR